MKNHKIKVPTYSNIVKTYKMFSDVQKTAEKEYEKYNQLKHEEMKRLNHIEKELKSENEEQLKRHVIHELKPYIKYIDVIESRLLEFMDEETYETIEYDGDDAPESIEDIFDYLTDKMNRIAMEIKGLEDSADFMKDHPPYEIKRHKRKLIITQHGNDTILKAPDIDFSDYVRHVDDTDALTPLVQAMKIAKDAVFNAESVLLNYWNLNEMNQAIKDATKTEKNQLLNKLTKEYNEQKFIKLSDKEEAIQKAVTHFEETENAYGTDFVNGSRDFPSKLVLGDVTIPFEGAVSDGLKALSIVTEHKGGQYNTLKVPYVIDLEEHSAIVLDVDDKTLSSSAKKLTHQLIVQFLLAYPAKYLKLCLIDVKEKGNPEYFNDLKSISNSIIMDKLVISKEGVSPALKKLEEARWDVQANKLANSEAENIFDYNDASRSNPEPLHLLVLYNYPEGISESDVERLEKLLEFGPRSGIYTLIVNNKDSYPNADKKNFGASPFSKTAPKEALEYIVEKATLQGVVFEPKTKTKFTLKDGKNSTNKTLLDSLSFQSRFEIEPADIRKTIKVLRKNQEESEQEVIPIQEMFSFTDKELDQDRVKSPFKVLDIPIGRKGSNIQKLRFNTEGNDVHAIMIGGTGSGKSNFLHTLLLSAAYRYNPRDLNVYLVDFKGGVEFDSYRNNPLPHVRLAALTSEQEDGVAVLSKIERILSKREDLFRRMGNVSSIDEYNETVPKDERLPRILTIIDEVQYLFKQNEDLAQTVVEILSGILNKGRAFGISILWASQNIPKTTHAVGVRSEIVGKIRNRIALKLNDPSEASELGMDPSKIKAIESGELGVGLISDARNNYHEEAFRVAFAEKANAREHVIALINKRWEDRMDSKALSKHTMHIVGNDAIARVKNSDSIFKKPMDSDTENHSAYTLAIGENYVTGEEMNLSLNLRTSGAHVWLNGFDQTQIKSVMGWMMLSIMRSHITVERQDSETPTISFADGDHNFEDDSVMNKVRETFSRRIETLDNEQAFVETLVRLYTLRNKRSRDIKKRYTPVFFMIHKAQAFHDLINSDTPIDLDNPKVPWNEAADAQEPQENSMFFSPKSNKSSRSDKVSIKTMLKKLLNQGADVGIHLVISFDRLRTLNAFENELESTHIKILFKGVNESDMINLIPRRQIKYLRNLRKEVGLVSHHGEIDKFKPYHFSEKQDMKYLETVQERTHAQEGETLG